jgi:hypothetical protein
MNRKDLEKEVARVRVEKMARWMLLSEKNVSKDCPLHKILEKSFIERVLWLEDQTKFTLDHIIAQCEACNKCNFREMPSQT